MATTVIHNGNFLRWNSAFSGRIILPSKEQLSGLRVAAPPGSVPWKDTRKGNASSADDTNKTYRINYAPESNADRAPARISPPRI